MREYGELGDDCCLYCVHLPADFCDILFSLRPTHSCRQTETVRWRQKIGKKIHFFVQTFQNMPHVFCWNCMYYVWNTYVNSMVLRMHYMSLSRNTYVDSIVLRMHYMSLSNNKTSHNHKWKWWIVYMCLSHVALCYSTVVEFVTWKRVCTFMVLLSR